MKHLIILLACYLFVNGCSAQKKVTFADADALLKAASQIQIGDTRDEVAYYLGWRKDQGQLEVSWDSQDNRGEFIHPRINFWRWKAYPVSLYVGFTDDSRVYQIRYYDDRRKPDGPYMMIGQDYSKNNEQIRIAEL